MIEQLLTSAPEFDFYRAVYLIERQLQAQSRVNKYVGGDGVPRDELIRFKSVQNLGFPGPSVVRVTARNENDCATKAFDMHVSFMGLTGPSGVMPRHYTEMVLQRLKNRDTTMRDFFDLFNHRIISLYYRAWKKYRLDCHYEQETATRVSPASTLLTAFSGGQAELQRYYAGHFNKQNRSAAGLRAMLRDMLGCEVKIKQLQGRWLTISMQERTCLASGRRPEGQFSRLGCDATLGKKVWDISSSIKVVLLMQGRVGVANLLPGTVLSQQVKNLVNTYVGVGVKASIELRSRADDLPGLVLGARVSCLARNARLGVSAAGSDKTLSIVL